MIVLNRYLALLRGINVGGKAQIRMSELKVALSNAGLENVTTYIQSGNVIFSTKETDVNKLAEIISVAVEKDFGFKVDVIVLGKIAWENIIKSAPEWWGNKTDWKHNLIVMLRPYDMKETMRAIGNLKPEIEAAQAGDGVIYQSMSIKLFGRTTTGKLSASPIYKRMTIRNHNTATKLLELLN